jgi:large subunit ribosomal protein L18
MNIKVLERKKALRAKRKKRIRAKISGTTELPRVSFFRSNRYLSAQAIDDVAGNTLVGLHGKSLQLQANSESAKKLGVTFAEKLKEKGIENVVFDRNGYEFHGVVADFANSLRDSGINF